MIEGCKICGVSDLDTLSFIVNHPYPPKFIGFICNYQKSPRYVEFDKLEKLLNINKNNCQYVAVLVKPNEEILEKIKNLPFDYYQLYDCTPEQISFIKNTYNKKIITAFTIKEKSDLEKYQDFNEVTDIYLFDSKGYEKSEAFNHDLIKDLKIDKKLMIAGNIKFNDDLINYGKIADFIDLSGGLESSGLKDLSKIEIFLKKVKQIKNET